MKIFICLFGCIGKIDLQGHRLLIIPIRNDLIKYRTKWLRHAGGLRDDHALTVFT